MMAATNQLWYALAGNMAAPSHGPGGNPVASLNHGHWPSQSAHEAFFE